MPSSQIIKNNSYSWLCGRSCNFLPLSTMGHYYHCRVLYPQFVPSWKNKIRGSNARAAVWLKFTTCFFNDILSSPPFFSLSGQCDEPLGLESGALEDHNLLASSSFDTHSTGPHNARWVRYFLPVPSLTVGMWNFHFRAFLVLVSSIDLSLR